MIRTLKFFAKYRDWRMVTFAGLLGFVVSLATVEIIDLYSVSLTGLSIALAAVAGTLLGVCLVGSWSGLRVRQKLREQNKWLDAALNNMVQGLCMFDAKDRLMVWNERYCAMYGIDRKHIWRGCGIRDLLRARQLAGTFPHDMAQYEKDLLASLARGKAFTINIELPDGRSIAVVNTPTAGGGWVATHEDVTERKRAERELDKTRAFLNMIVENVPSPIIVKNASDLKYLLVNHAAEEYFGIDRAAIIGKTTADILAEGHCRYDSGRRPKNDRDGPDLLPWTSTASARRATARGS